MQMRVSFMSAAQSEVKTILALRVPDVFVGELNLRGVARVSNFIICLARIERV